MASADKETAVTIEPESRKRPAPRGTAAYPRKRAITACQVCRARRTKCDNRKPSCSCCMQIGATCVQSSVDLSSFDPASLKILDRIDDLERLLRDPTGLAPASLPSHADFTPAGQAAVDAGDTARGKDLLPAGADDILRWPFFGNLSDSFSPASEREVPLLGRVQSTAATSPVGLSDLDLDFEPVGALVEAFFENVHVKNPVLDEGKTRRLISRMSLHGFDASAESCLALLICALGGISSSFHAEHSVQLGSPSYQKASSYFQAAQKRIGPLIVAGGVLSTQCLFFSGVFMATVFSINAAWRYFTQALMCCQEFITQDPSSREDEPVLRPNLLSPEEQSIYWSAWKSERELRALLRHQDFPISDAGMYPPFYPTPPPAPEVNERNSHDGMLQRQNTSWFFYLSEISLRRLSTRITQEIVELRPEHKSGSLIALLVQCVAEWEAQIQQWTNGLSESMSLSNHIEPDDICRWVLRGQHVNLFELIYWPFLQEVIAGCPSCADGELAEPVYVLANKALKIHAQRLEINRSGMLHRHHGTIFMIEACTRSALLLLYVASEQGKQSAVSDLTMPATWLNGVHDVMAMNRHWERESVNAQRWASAIAAALERGSNS